VERTVPLRSRAAVDVRPAIPRRDGHADVDPQVNDPEIGRLARPVDVAGADDPPRQLRERGTTRESGHPQVRVDNTVCPVDAALLEVADHRARLYRAPVVPLGVDDRTTPLIT
jgi:hypothetical protein